MATVSETCSPRQRLGVLPIQFLIIGGGLAGLCCAIALRRVGHQVLLLEKDIAISSSRIKGEGCRLPPNQSKILFHWGLESQLRKIALKSDAINLRLHETGELLGSHVWTDEVLRETRGVFLLTHFGDLRKLLYDTALLYGAKIRLGTPVTAIDGQKHTVTLSTGQFLTADVIIGADGEFGLSRQLLLEEEGLNNPTLNMYSTTIPKQLIMADPELRSFYDGPLTMQNAWFGNKCGALGFPLGGKSDFALFVYCPKDGRDGSRDDAPSIASLQKVLGSCENRLRKLGELASPPVCLSFGQNAPLEEWVSGRLIVVGQAAHPMPAGTLQGNGGMSTEDGAVLARLFSHLKSLDQIDSFLEAFQDIRQRRCESVHAKESGVIAYMTMEPCGSQEYRDRSMREKRDAGINVLDSTEDMEETPEWVEIKEIFGYDAEDDADNWWVEWGLLRERSKLASSDASSGMVSLLNSIRIFN